MTNGANLSVRVNDLYVTEINGQPFEQYAKTLNTLTPEFGGLVQRIRDLSRTHGREGFESRSLIVMCVAESLRSDRVATSVEQMIRATTVGLHGAQSKLGTGELLSMAHAWGQASDAIFQAISPTAQDIVRKPRTQLSTVERQFSERVDINKIDAGLREFAKSIKVLKRPTS